MAADAVGGILLAGVTLYAVLGGADFGGGLWDLLAGGDRRGRAPRVLIDESITAVWEANHVWLVFDLVIFWTAFPHAFAAVMTALALPLWLAVAGIVLRGSGFAFRKEVTSLRWQRVTGAVFAFSSLVTPFFMGTVIGAIATGAVPANASHASLTAWTSPTALLAGFLFVTACGYLAAVYLTGEAARRGDQRMRVYFTRRAEAAAIVAGALSLAALAELHGSNPALYGRLTGRALPLVVLAGACGLAVLVLLAIGRGAGTRIIAALGVAAVVWGWGVAQYPVLLPGTAVTLSNAGAPDDTLVALVVLFIVAAAIIGPSFVLLFLLQSRRLLAGEGGMVAAAVPVSQGRRQAASPGQPSAAPGPGSRAAVLALVIANAVARRRRSRLRPGSGIMRHVPLTVPAAASAAAVRVAARLGVAGVEPVVLNDGANVIVWLSPSPVVAKVAASTPAVRPDVAAWLERELDLAAFLARSGIPVLAPSAEVPAAVHRGDGHVMSFWTYLKPAGTGLPGEAVIGSMLRDLHAALRSYPGSLPVLAPLRDIPAFLARPATRLSAADLANLAGACTRLTAELAACPADRQPLHGDAGAGNLMAAGGGWVWHDFEDTCAGPVAWDLAASTASPRLDRSRILAAYRDHVDPALLRTCEQLRRLHLTVWYALYAERLPDCRERAAGLLRTWRPQ